MYITVSCVLAVSIVGLVAMLIQGCKREKPEDTLTPPPLDFTNTTPVIDTNTPDLSFSNPPVSVPPFDTNPPALVPPVAPVEPVVPPAATGSEYTIVKGDTLAVIAKKNGVSLSALQTANPGVVPTKLKIGQKITIPAGGSVSATSVSPTMSAEAGVTVYTVKSGDTLTTIAKKFGTTIKAIESANNLLTTKIKVGQKLKIPGKVAAAPVAPAPAPVTEPAPAPALPPISAPAPAPTK